MFLLIGVGANLAWGGRAPRETCEAACGVLARALGGRSVRGRWFSAASWPDASAPRYVNGVLRVDGAAATGPEAVLDLLLATEAAFGRERGGANAPRTLDLDLLDVDGAVRDGPDPVLPHPRMQARGFVLWPLRDVMPGWRHPRLGVGVDALLGALPPEDTHPL